MKNVYFDTNELDNRVVSEFGISQEILLENAGGNLERLVRKKLKKGSKILALCGTGNNGADALCALRKLSGDYECYALLIGEKQNKLNQKQANTAKIANVKFVSKLGLADCYIDGIFGTGLNKELDPELCKILKTINKTNALKIAVDIPSGIYKDGKIGKIAFEADYTMTMGALKAGLFSDTAKDFVGKIKVANLGLSEKNFQNNSDMFLLTKDDLNLPFRKTQNTNKGEFGHTFLIAGDMLGAAQIAGLAASAIGSGLVSVVSEEPLVNLNPLLMQKKSLQGAKVVVCGPGLGNKKVDLAQLKDKICVIDADLCYNKEVIELLSKNENIVLTPHPKEFVSLLKLANIADVSVSELQENRFKYAKMWSEKFKSVLVLKGANTIIAQNSQIYISNLGSCALAKGGSGDVLAGIIAGLLAQGYTPLDAATNGVLAHALSAKKFKQNDYSLNSLDIIKGLKWL